MKARVRQLLTGPDGQIPNQLHGVATLLLVDYTAEQAREALNGCQWVQLLGELVAKGKPISHELLDDLGPSMEVRHLRHVLVHTGALEEQGEGLEGLEPWLRGIIRGVSPATATVLRRYVLWSVLPRARRRASRDRMRGSTPKFVRTRIMVARQFLTWLEGKQIALADATQHDVNTCLRQGATTRYRLRDFLLWAGG